MFGLSKRSGSFNIDTSGKVVVKYYYNPEAELYYLQSRYYDPKIGRFITIDDISYLDPDTVNGLNLYAYCGNNPIMNIDPTGNSFTAFLIGMAISFFVTWAAGEIFGHQLVGGIGSVVGGGHVSIAFNVSEFWERLLFNENI